MPLFGKRELKSIDELTDVERQDVASVKREVYNLLACHAAEFRAISRVLGFEEPEGLSPLIEEIYGGLKEGAKELIARLEEGAANLPQPYEEDELVRWIVELSEDMTSDLGMVNDWAKRNRYDSTITDPVTDGLNLVIRQAKNAVKVLNIRDVKSAAYKSLAAKASEIMQLYRSASVMSPPELRSFIGEFEHELKPYLTWELNNYLLRLQGESIPPEKQGEMLRRLNTEVAQDQDILEKWALVADCTAEAQGMLRHASMLTSAIENAYRTFPGDVVKASKTPWERFKESVREYFSGPSTSPESLGIAWDWNDKE